jgi:NAD(P)-dependent dehydrogenase (short-subunit alcohol dehydrogenase family)
MSKESISKSYMEEQKERHGWKLMKATRRALITGADNKNSIGESIAQKLAAEGFYLTLLTKEKNDITHGLPQTNPNDTLVCCHGFSHLDWIENISHLNIEETISVNLTGSIMAVRDFVRDTIDKPYKKYIVLTGSMAAFSVLNGSAAYCAAKAGLAHFVRCAAWELAPKGFLVFGVHPSNTEGTPMTEETIQGLMRYRDLSREEAEAYWGASLPMQNWLQPQDIAETVAWLVSGKADYLSGANIPLAGGQR